MKNIFTIAIIIATMYSSAFSQSGWFWQNPLPQGNSLQSVHFIDNETGWTVGNAGTVLKTIDG
jgi:photosystem II stability/assembly factor-like uncharacterized protein